MSLDAVRTVADAVLYEGYLLYPYRASAGKNRMRWQFGVLGPAGATEHGVGEEPAMATECVLSERTACLDVHLRFLQLQARSVEATDAQGGHTPVPGLGEGAERVLAWDEAVDHEIVLSYSAAELRSSVDLDTTLDRTVSIPGGEDVEDLVTGEGPGRVVRRRWPLQARVSLKLEDDADLVRVRTQVENLTPLAPADQHDRDAGTRRSLLGTHLLITVDGARFLSVIDPPQQARAVAERCRQHRCWPVLMNAGPGPRDPAGDSSSDVVLGSPIILYDFPEVAEESAGQLFDSTEIDEILTLRVMTMTDAEKTEARATDARAAEIIERCDALGEADLARLHGVLRDPRKGAQPGAPDQPGAEGTVLVGGVRVGKDSLVRLHPSRRADAHDLFYAGQVARVTAVLEDVDGATHVALVLLDDPAADLHEWYGRYLYFSPDELEPMNPEQQSEAARALSDDPVPREESRP